MQSPRGMRTYLNLIAALASLSLTAGCITEGERAWSNECPDGEVCSPNEPQGLYFQGSPRSDDFLGLDTGVGILAAGGTQTIEVMNADIHPLAYAFQATLQGGPFTMTTIAPPDVTLACSAEGSTHLRIIDPANGLLLDKVEVTSRPVAAVEAGPLPTELPASDTVEWALLAGTGRAYVALKDGWDTRLTDESTRLAAVDDGVTTGTQVAWDAIELTRATGGTAQVAVTPGDGQRRTADVPFVDLVESVTYDTDIEVSAAVGLTSMYCFVARTGNAQVYGAEWTFATSGPLGSPEHSFLPNCTDVAGLATGVGSITATAGGASTTVNVAVTLPPAQSYRRVFTGGAKPQAGLRARAAQAQVAASASDGR
jgi:hypothetical protein